MGRIIDREELKKEVERLREEGKRIVFTNGCFDIIHVGHIRYLREAKAQGDVLIVGLNSDSSVRMLKGEKRPLVPQGERAEILSALEMVDYVVIFDELTPDELIKIVRPDVDVKGGDYKSLEDIPERELVESLGGKMMIVGGVEGKSTTNLVETILERYGA